MNIKFHKLEEREPEHNEKVLIIFNDKRRQAIYDKPTGAFYLSIQKFGEPKFIYSQTYYQTY